MILPLLHERSCKKENHPHRNNNKRTWETNTRPNINNKEVRKKHPPPPPPQQQQKKVREEDFVFVWKIFKNLCTRIAG